MLVEEVYFIFHFAAHPCDNGKNGGCDQVCEKIGTQGQCSCLNDFELAKDGVTCKKGKFA